MKAPDIVESWKWRPAEEIIERLIAISDRVPSVRTVQQTETPTRDRYYRMARRCVVRRAVKRVMRGTR